MCVYCGISDLMWGDISFKKAGKFGIFSSGLWSLSYFFSVFMVKQMQQAVKDASSLDVFMLTLDRSRNWKIQKTDHYVQHFYVRKAFWNNFLPCSLPRSTDNHLHPSLTVMCTHPPTHKQHEMITVIMIHTSLTWLRQSTLMAWISAGCLQYSWVIVN